MSISFFRRESELPPGIYLTDCAVSGGTLEGFLTLALSAAQGRLCVRLSPVYMDVPLPCPGGTGRFLSPQEAQSLPEFRQLRYSDALCTGYFTYLRDAALHLVLYDTRETLERKLSCCRRVGVPYVLSPEEGRMKAPRK